MYRTLDSFNDVMRIGNVLILDNKHKVFISAESGLRDVILTGKEVVMKAVDENGIPFLYLAKPAEKLTFGAKNA